MSTTPKKNRSLQERGCTSKVHYGSAPEAELAALTGMLERADVPLSVYECAFCAGFHLTSSQKVSDNTVEVAKPLTPTPVGVALHHQITRDSFDARKKKWHEGEKIKRAQRRRHNRDKKTFFEQNLPPQIASAQEVEAFFARHGHTA